PERERDSQLAGDLRRPSASSLHDAFQPRHDPYPLPQSPFDPSHKKSSRLPYRAFTLPTTPPTRRDSGLGPTQTFGPLATPPSYPSPRHSSQRSASLNTELHQESCHPYDLEQKSRTDRAKSDFALHQQNYGPYLDTSPEIATATLFTQTTERARDGEGEREREGVQENRGASSSSRHLSGPHDAASPSASASTPAPSPPLATASYEH
ncbi:hypothetical protein BG004_003013, partial [Podila humilis]